MGGWVLWSTHALVWYKAGLPDTWAVSHTIFSFRSATRLGIRGVHGLVERRQGLVLGWLVVDQDGAWFGWESSGHLVDGWVVCVHGMG